jgi:hypothetical protein
MLACDMSAIHKNAEVVVRREVDRAFVTDPVLQRQGASDRLEDRPFLHEAPHQRVGSAGGFREVQSLSSMRCSAAVMVTA